MSSHITWIDKLGVVTAEVLRIGRFVSEATFPDLRPVPDVVYMRQEVRVGDRISFKCVWQSQIQPKWGPEDWNFTQPLNMYVNLYIQRVTHHSKDWGVITAVWIRPNI